MTFSTPLKKSRCGYFWCHVNGLSQTFIHVKLRQNYHLIIVENVCKTTQQHNS